MRILSMELQHVQTKHIANICMIRKVDVVDLLDKMHTVRSFQLQLVQCLGGAFRVVCLAFYNQHRFAE